jgi:hypothetical protein
MKAMTLKVVIGIGAAALMAGLALMIWAGFAMSVHGG